MLSLGLAKRDATDTQVELSDVLTAELEFNTAYQAFINYRNTCEIVVKAQTSVERMNFAKELLGVSVESIQISTESLVTTLKLAWEKFMSWCRKAISYIKYSFMKYDFDKQDLNLHIDITFDYLNHSINFAKEATNMIITGKYDLKKLKDIDSVAVRSQDQPINTRKELLTWLRLADQTIYAWDRLIKLTTKKEDPTDPEEKQLIRNAAISSKDFMDELSRDIKAIIHAAKNTKSDKSKPNK